MQFDPKYAAFRTFLHGSIAETLLWWVNTHPGQQMAPEVLTGLTTRRIPRSRSGKLNLHLDEAIWSVTRKHA